MELEDKPLNPQESLLLIEKFISGTRGNIKRSAFGFIFWGILIAVASFGNYLLMLIIKPEMAGLIWPVLTIGGFIVTMIYFTANPKKDGAVSTFGHFFKWLFLCGGITYFLFVFLSVKEHISPTPFMLALTALLITVAGLAMRFKPMIFGGILFFVVSIISVFVTPVNQLLLVGGSFIIGYLIPGILLVRKKEE